MGAQGNSRRRCVAFACSPGCSAPSYWLYSTWEGTSVSAESLRKKRGSLHLFDAASSFIRSAPAFPFRLRSALSKGAAKIGTATHAHAAHAHGHHHEHRGAIQLHHAFSLPQEITKRISRRSPFVNPFPVFMMFFTLVSSRMPIAGRNRDVKSSRPLANGGRKGYNIPV